MIELGGSFAWCSDERSYHKKPYKPDWGLVKQAPYSNTLHTANWYTPSNWNNKPLLERVTILVNARKGKACWGNLDQHLLRHTLQQKITKSVCLSAYMIILLARDTR